MKDKMCGRKENDDERAQRLMEYGNTKQWKKVLWREDYKRILSKKLNKKEKRQLASGAPCLIQS